MKDMSEISDILSLRRGDTISSSQRHKLFTGNRVGNTPQKGINWLGNPPNYELVMARSTSTFGYGDRWIDNNERLYLYYLMIENRGTEDARINYSSKENLAVLNQRIHLAPILLMTNSTKRRDLIDIQGRFEVVTLCHDNPIHPGVDSVLLKRIL